MGKKFIFLCAVILVLILILINSKCWREVEKTHEEAETYFENYIIKPKPVDCDVFDIKKDRVFPDSIIWIAFDCSEENWGDISHSFSLLQAASNTFDVVRSNTGNKSRFERYVYDGTSDMDIYYQDGSGTDGRRWFFRKKIATGYRVVMRMVR